MKQKPTKKCEHGVQLRPASIEEAGLFYSELDETQDEALGTVGHVRMDFGSGGKEFWHTWWPHNEDRFNTLEFKEELQVIVDTLRANGPLKDLTSMSNYCYKNGGAITEDSRSFGYVAETDHYRYCLRCTPTPGDYQGYLYCYDKRQQEMAQKDKIVGRVTYADGTAQEFTDPHQYLQTIKEELPFRNTTGFKHETLSEDPEVKKAVDDMTGKTGSSSRMFTTPSLNGRSLSRSSRSGARSASAAPMRGSAICSPAFWSVPIADTTCTSISIRATPTSSISTAPTTRATVGAALPPITSAWTSWSRSCWARSGG